MTKKKSNKKSTKKIVHKVPAPPKPHLVPQIVFSVLLIIILIAIAMTYKVAVTGQAIKTAEFDLDFQKSAKVAVNTVKSMNIVMKTNITNPPKNFTIDYTLSKGVLNYAVKEENKILVQGLLSDKLSLSGPLYLDEDEKADLSLSYNFKALEATNLNYVTPEFAKISVTDFKGNVIPNNVLKSAGDAFFQFKVSSTKKPTVSAKWKTGAVSKKEFTLVKSDDTSATYRLNWKPEDKKAHILIVNAKVEDKEISKQFIVTAGDYIYFLDEPNHPQISMLKSSSGLSVEYSVAKGIQPLSLLCGSLNIDTIKSNVKTIKTFDPLYEVEQWKLSTPSEFTTLTAKRGYVLDVDKPFAFKINCDKPETSLPELDDGWNLVGIPGNVAVSTAKLVAPVGSQVDDIYLVSGSTNVEVTSNKLDPGKVYWVEVESK